MDVIRYLLKFLFKVAFFLFFAAIVWWLVATFFPALSLRSIISLNHSATSTREGWLPSPRSYKGLFGNVKIPSANDNVYVAGEPYNGYGEGYNGNQGGADVEYITYTSSGTKVTRYGRNAVFDSSQDLPSSKNTNNNGYAQKNLFIRNLSIYQGGHVYTGLSFFGEARDSMFLNGKFPIIIVNQSGQVVSISNAEATTNWTIPGWVRFQVKIDSVLPDKVPCTMIFEQASQQYSYQEKQPTRVAIPVMCN